MLYLGSRKGLVMGSQLRETTSDIVGFDEEDVVMVIESLITSLVLRVVLGLLVEVTTVHVGGSAGPLGRQSEWRRDYIFGPISLEFQQCQRHGQFFSVRLAESCLFSYFILLTSTKNTFGIFYFIIII